MHILDSKEISERKERLSSWIQAQALRAAQSSI